MKTVFHHVVVNKPMNADDATAVSLTISVTPDLARASITTLMTIAAARELSLKIARAADEAELKLPEGQ